MADDKHPGNSANKGNSVGCGSKLASNIMKGLKEKKKVKTTNVGNSHPWSLKQLRTRKEKEYTFSGLQAHHLIPSSLVHKKKSKAENESTENQLACICDSIKRIDKKIDELNRKIATHSRNVDLDNENKATHQRHLDNRSQELEDMVSKRDHLEESKDQLEIILKEEQGNSAGPSPVRSPTEKENREQFNKKWSDLFNKIEYDINCAENGVFLPSLLEVACKMHVPLHRGAHDLGFNYAADGNWESPQNLKNYYAWVRDKLTKISKLADKKCADISEKDLEEAKESLLGVSEDALAEISNFKLTITADGNDYKKGGIGCANKTGISEKDYGVSVKAALESSEKIRNLEEKNSDLEREIQNEALNSEKYRSLCIENDMILDEIDAEKEIYDQSVKSYRGNSLNCCCDRSHKGDLGGLIDKLTRQKGKLKVGDMHLG